MAEVLEGILSEAMLEELALDLGCDPQVMRKHPFFRVLKGRVLLTYPLKTGGFENYLKGKTQIFNAITLPGVAGDVINLTGEGILTAVGLYAGDDSPAHNNIRVTIDGVEIFDEQMALVGANLAASMSIPLMFYFETSCQVEMWGGASKRGWASAVYEPA